MENIESMNRFAPDTQQKNGLALANEKFVKLREKFLELQVEFDNYRNRTAKEKEQLSVSANIDLLRSIINNMDILFSWAQKGEAETEVERGLLLAIREMYNKLEKSGLSRIDTDSNFDPDLHEAIDTVTTVYVARDGKVAKVHCNGYTYKGDLINPARVSVYKEGVRGI